MLNTMTRLRREEGFTLIELLIVIVVLGILAGIVIFAIGGVKGDAESKSSSSNVKICATARSVADVQDGNAAAYTKYVDNSTKC